MANALQAVLDRAAQETQAPAVERAPKAAKPARAPQPKKPKPEAPVVLNEDGAEDVARTFEAAEMPRARNQRPVRVGKRFVGGHFDPEVARQLRIIAAEDDTSIQELLEEAIQLLFLKKGRDLMVAATPGSRTPKHVLP